MMGADMGDREAEVKCRGKREEDSAEHSEPKTQLVLSTAWGRGEGDGYFCFIGKRMGTDMKVRGITPVMLARWRQ